MSELGLACGVRWLLGFPAPLSCPALVILSHSAPVQVTEGSMDLFSLEVKGYFARSTFSDLACYPHALLGQQCFQDGHLWPWEGE